MQKRRILVLRSLAAIAAVGALIGSAVPASAQVFIGPRDVVVANVATVESTTMLVLDTGQRVILLGLAWLGPSRRSPDAASYADAGTAFVRNLVEGKRVYLHFDKQKYDLDGNLIAYVYMMKDGMSVNAETIRQGYARAFGGYYQNVSAYARLQRQAWQSNVGLWARLPRPAATPKTVTASRSDQTAVPPSTDIAELTTLDLRPSKPYVAAGRVSNALNNQRPADQHVIAFPLQSGAELFIGSNPTNVGRVTTSVRKKVNQDTAPKSQR
jgi:hypothetical protein